ncbi:hypothetical protein HHL21_12260 [Massilia sp. RP-1-19]|uniref:Uncharacterized protein n=1 Tax=Massilia polaris TaxID=2728846 RepID=A0A848HKS9_9BURK|nr:hypothetical protein [Massilia polaris]NML61834.1 hypothetical protein [Massilia polaris]
MATLNASITLSLGATLVNALDLGDVTQNVNNASNFALTDGTGANQAKSLFSDTRTLAASGTENLDLAATLIDAFGAAITFTKIKALIIKASAANTNDVVVGGHATAACFSFFGAATHTLKVKPGGMIALVAPDANGYPVTATTADMLTVTNSAGGTGVTYDVIIIGVA